jgi:hypothetical protein
MSTYPLADSWTFWAVGTDPKVYDVNPLPKFSTVEDFWGWWELIPPLADMKYGSIALFKGELTPAWENLANETRVRMNSTREELIDVWEFLVLKLIGGTIAEDLPKDSICGIYYVSSKEPCVEIWYGNARPDIEAVKRLLSEGLKYTGRVVLRPFRR